MTACPESSIHYLIVIVIVMFVLVVINYVYVFIMDFFDFAIIISGGEDECKAFLQANGLIRSVPPACPHPACVATNGRMALSENTAFGRRERLRWR